jgi:hypothetical protein
MQEIYTPVSADSAHSGRLDVAESCPAATIAGCRKAARDETLDRRRSIFFHRKSGILVLNSPV